MNWLLDLGYLVSGLVGFPWLVYLLAAPERRKGLLNRLGLRGLEPAADECIWLHGASAGEVSLLVPLVERLERDFPDVPLVISGFSPTGMQTAQKSFSRHRVVYFPLDLAFVIRRFLRRLRPRLIVLVESEFWPNLILSADRAGIPVAIINGKVSAKSYGLYRRTALIPFALRRVDVIAAQTDEHAGRLRSLGVAAERIHVTGNMKYDIGAPATPPTLASDERAGLGFGRDQVLIIGGSLHRGEDEAMISAFGAVQGEFPQAGLILVPRYPADAPRVVELARRAGMEAVLKTALAAGERPAPGGGAILIVDTLGELRRLYALSDIAYVGGSLFYRGRNKGGHNLMEPAVLGVPVVFGPHNLSFKDTVEDLMRAGAGLMVHDRDELRDVLARLVADPQERRRLGEGGRRVVLAGKGATDRNYELLRPLLAGLDARPVRLDEAAVASGGSRSGASLSRAAR